jgi:hypothetical protein
MFAHKIHEVMMAVNVKITHFYGIVLYSFVDSYRSFEGTVSLHLLYPETTILFPVLYSHQNGTEAVQW